MTRSKGFTLIELMVTLAVAAVLVSLVMPSMQRLLQANGLASQANTLLSAVNLARSEAVKRSLPVHFMADGGDYANGWCVNVATNCTSAIKVGEFSSDLVLDGSTSVTFDSRGQRTSESGVAEVIIGLQPTGCTTGDSLRRTVSINIGGRAKVEEGSC